MTDRTFLFAFDLGGRDIRVVIEKVVQGEVPSAGGKRTKRPVVYFAGKDKPLALNSTNANTIAAIYGHYVESWIGKPITLYPTTTEMAGQTVECIRIRPVAPQ